MERAARGSGRRWIALGILLASSTTKAAGWPSLEEAIALARTRAPQVLAARGEVAVAESSAVRAGLSSVGNPYVQVFSDSPLNADRGGVYVQPELYVPLALPGQRDARLAESERLVGWRRREGREAEGRAIGETVGAWGGLVAAHLRLDAARTAEQLAQEESALVAERARLQDATALDESLARAELARLAQARREAELHLIEARARLRVLTGLDPADAPPASLGLPHAKRPWTAAALAAAVDASPALAAFEAQESYWLAAHDRAEREAWQPLSLILWGSRSELGAWRAGAGFGVTLPVTDANAGEVARVAAERERAKLSKSAAREILQGRAAAAWSTLTTAAAALADANERALPAAEAVVTAADDAFRAGKVDRTRVLLARRDLAAARERRVLLVEAGWRACGELAAILGELP